MILSCPGNSNQLELYMHVIPPRLAQPTLAAIGYIRSRGAVGPTAELQVRYALKVFKKEVELPSHQDMMADVKRRRDAVVKQYGVNQPKVSLYDFFFLENLFMRV